MISIVIGAFGTVNKSRESGGFGNRRTSGDHQNYSTVKIGHSTEKSPEDLRRPAVSQTPVEDHWLAIVRKALKQGK